ncbi:MAG: DUF2760 domain-containing protein [Chitinispirillaceae bacterium]|nr:DUF2760 domain-containing protein [Chitinispirillaceae bacterium]
MNRIEVALRSFFWIIFNKRFSDKVAEFFSDLPPSEPEVVKKEIKPVKKKQSDSIQLLAAFQREGRLVDFLMEPIDTYSDAQIGAAVRDVHRDCKSVLDRVCAPHPISENEEGKQVTVPAGFDPSFYRLSGNVTGKPPFNGVVRHRGWNATRLELPQWQGSDESATIIAPVEVELP